MNKQISLLVISSAILLGSCSSAALPNGTNNSQMQDKINKLTGNPLDITSNDEQGKQPKVVENVTTKFWPASPHFKMKAGTVTKVNDDQTIEIDEKETVRLIGIRTTEENQTARKYFTMLPIQADAFIKKSLLNQKVYIETNPFFQTNKNGETLAFIWTGDAKELKNFNAEVVQEGLAVAERLENVTVYDKEFKDIENAAEKDHKGIWANQ